MQAASKEAQDIRTQILTAGPTEKEALQAQAVVLETRAAEARKSELRSLEWKPLWGKPALFAAIVLVVFLALFRETKPASQN